MIETGTIVNMEFASEKRLARLHSPLKKFRIDEQVVEHRRDPLTGRRNIVRGRRGYVKRDLQTDEASLLQTAQQTREGCPFCPERAEKSAPRFPAGLVSEGMIRVGEAGTFPSLFARPVMVTVTKSIRFMIARITDPLPQAHGSLDMRETFTCNRSLHAHVHLM